MDTTLEIPVTATMAKQPDGSFTVENAEYVDFIIEDVYEFLKKKYLREVSKK